MNKENFKTEKEFLDFKAVSLKSLQLAEPVVRKHKMKLAIENHKDWRAAELVEIIKGLDSEWMGVTLDFGNNLSLLEKPDEVIALLAPYSFSTHIKDMGVKSYSKGFLLSEVPLGEGIVDLGGGELVAEGHEGVSEGLGVDLAVHLEGLEGLDDGFVVVGTAGHLLGEQGDHLGEVHGSVSLIEHVLKQKIFYYIK